MKIWKWKYCISLAAFFCAVFLAGCAGTGGGTLPEGSAVSQGDSAGHQNASEAGGESAEAADGGKKRDILRQRVQVMELPFNYGFFYDPDNENYGTFLGAQFYQGEPAAIWGYQADSVNQFHFLDDGTVESREVRFPGREVYLRRADGSDELVAWDLPDELFPGVTSFLWYVDRDGGVYCASRKADEDGRYFFLKLDGEKGGSLYKTYLEPGWRVEKILQASDGGMYLSLKTADAGQENCVYRLAAFDLGTGAVSGADTVLYKSEPPFYHSKEFLAGEDGIYIYDSFGYQKVDTRNGTFSDYMMFAGTTYSPQDPAPKGLTRWEVRDRYVYADGRIEILKTVETSKTVEIPEGINEDSNEEFKAYAERVRNNKGASAGSVNYEVILDTLQWFEGDRIQIAVRGDSISAWIKDQAVRFNRENAVYQVVLEDFASSGAADLDDYARQTSVELTSGKGPDILCGSLMEDYIQGLLDKGALLDLREFMASSGIREEDYLPAAFGSWRDTGEEDGGIYGADVFLYPYGYKISRDVVGGAGVVDIYMLMEALSTREEEAVYYGLMGPESLLRMFLEGSGNLWGAVDWERGVCDFGGELFAQILEASKRYGYDGRHRYQNLAQLSRLTDVYRYDSPRELEAEGMAVCGALFDDGCHGMVDSRGTLAVSAGSAHKEGAWEFLCFLLGEEAQTEAGVATVPVNRAVLDGWLEEQLQKVAGGRVYEYGDSYIDYGEPVKIERSYTSADMTQERVAGYLEALEEVRHLPYRTGPLLDIICEEAGGYFDGDRSLEDVVRVIQNRVQLYLDEHRRGGI